MKSNPKQAEYCVFTKFSVKSNPKQAEYFVFMNFSVNSNPNQVENCSGNCTLRILQMKYTLKELMV